jgi:PmbA protein
MDFRDNEGQLKSLVEEILTEAARQGSDQAEVSASLDTGLSVNVRKGELENLEFNQDKGFGITVYFGQRKGSASTTDSSDRAIVETVTAARQIATHTQDDPCNGLAASDLMPRELPDLDLFHPWDVTPERATEIALECEAAGLGVDERLTNSDGAQVSTQQSMRVYGNSHGFVGASAGTRHGVSCVLIGEDDNGMQRDYWYTTARMVDELEDVAEVGRKAGERTVARLSARKAPTGSYPVLFAAPMASGLFGHLTGAISGGALYRSASFLLDSLGTQVMPEWLSIIERPHLPRALASANFDGDGVATWEKPFVKGGVIESYILSTYSGRKLGMETTGNAGGVHNLDIEAPSRPLAELLREMDTGLYVHELMGQGVNAVTGDYSRGAAGFWVSGGEIQYPVEEVTIAGNLKEIFKNIVALGDDVDYRSNIRAPSVLLGELTVAGE